MYVATDHLIENVSPTATAVQDEHAPGVRVRYSSDLYLSLTVAEAVDLVDAIAGALAELDRTPSVAELHRDEDRVRADAELRESLT